MVVAPPGVHGAVLRRGHEHPGRVGLVAQKLAEIRTEDLATIARETYKNANRLFKPESSVDN